MYVNSSEIQLIPTGQMLQDIEIMPGTHEDFEFILAMVELLNGLYPKDLAFTKRIGKNFTDLFLLCKNNRLWEYPTFTKRTKYYKKNQYKLAYLTHNWFPYRGKSHGQLGRSLINILGIEKNSIILDPFCGSGTFLLEAVWLGYNVLGYDINQFAIFLAKTKIFALSTPYPHQTVSQLIQAFQNNELTGTLNNIVKLAYLDAISLARKQGRTRISHKEMLHKYLIPFRIFSKFQQSKEGNLGKATILLRNATTKNESLDDNSIDGIITSPPYANLIDYLKLDNQLIKQLGLSSKKWTQHQVGQLDSEKGKIVAYFDDMKLVLIELYRVLKKSRKLIFVVGNPERVKMTMDLDLDILLTQIAVKIGFKLLYRINRKIDGITSLIYEEIILIFLKI